MDAHAPHRAVHTDAQPILIRIHQTPILANGTPTAETEPGRTTTGTGERMIMADAAEVAARMTTVRTAIFMSLCFAFSWSSYSRAQATAIHVSLRPRTI